MRFSDTKKLEESFSSRPALLRRGKATLQAEGKRCQPEVWAHTKGRKALEVTTKFTRKSFSHYFNPFKSYDCLNKKNNAMHIWNTQTSVLQDSVTGARSGEATCAHRPVCSTPSAERSKDTARFVQDDAINPNSVPEVRKRCWRASRGANHKKNH